MLFRAAPKAYGSSIGVQSEQQLESDLCHSSCQCQILNPLSKARNQTLVLMDTRWVCYQWATMGTPDNLNDLLSINLLNNNNLKFWVSWELQRFLLYFFPLSLSFFLPFFFFFFLFLFLFFFFFASTNTYNWVTMWKAWLDTVKDYAPPHSITLE